MPSVVNPTILVIEDDADVRELIRINLGLEGYDVVLAANGPDGLQAASACRPSVILLDVMMPGIDGWDVLVRLKADVESGLAAVPVLMLTGRTDTMDRLRGGIEGAIRYLTKPFSMLALTEAVSDALTGAPEADRRRQVQHESLSELARVERGTTSVSPDGRPLARPRLSRLEPTPMPRLRVAGPTLAARQLGQLSPKQRQLIEAVGATRTVSAAAERLDVSRSNVYASLRRIARKLGVRSVTELVSLARAGSLG
jgi:DNA-binding response OmpR family regulator